MIPTIPAYCFTNLDGFTCYVKWFVAVPLNGQKVAVKYRGTETSLEVCQVIHRTKANGDPYIEVELTGRPRE